MAEDKGLEGIVGIDPDNLEISFMPSGKSFQQQLLEGVDFPTDLKDDVWFIDRETAWGYLTPELISLNAKVSTAVIDLKNMAERNPEMKQFALEEMTKMNAEMKTIAKSSRARFGFNTVMNSTEISKQEIKHKITDTRPSRFPFKQGGSE